MLSVSHRTPPTRLLAYLTVLLLLLAALLLAGQVTAEPQYTHINSCAEVDAPTCLEVTRCDNLTQSNTYYLLVRNLTSNRSCMYIAADNIVLDLNGYTITFGDTPVTGIPNAGFEAGLPDNASAPANWDISGAPHGTRVPTSVHPMDGRFAFRFANAQPGEEIVSDWEYLPLANRYYMASAIIATGACPHTISVEQEGGATACTRTIPSSWHAGMITCEFNGTAAGNYRVRLRIDDACSSFVDLVDLRPAYDIGILMARYYNPYYMKDLEPSITRNSLNVTIRNGRLVQGQGAGILNRGIDRTTLLRPSTLEIDRLYSYMSGVDSPNLANIPGYSRIHDSHFESDMPWVISRDALTGPMGIGPYDLVYNNRFEGGQGFLFIVVGPAESHTEIYNNTFVRWPNHTLATNHYGITSYDHSYLRIYDNTFDPFFGSGILLSFMNNTEVFGNRFNITTIPCNAEYTTRISTAGIRSTDYFVIRDAAKDNRLYNNTITVTGRSDPAFPNCTPRALAIFPSSIGTNNTWENNSFITLLDDAGAQAVSIFGSTQNDIYVRNYVESDQTWAYISNDYGPGVNLTFVDNVFAKGPNPTNFAGLRAGYWIFNTTGHRFLNNTFPAGEGLDDILYETNYWTVNLIDYTAQWYLDVRAQDQAGTPLPGATVEIRNRNGSLNHSGLTGADGRIPTQVLDEYLEYRYLSTQFSRNYSSPYTITVTHSGIPQSRVVNLSASRAESFIFNATSDTCAIPQNQVPCDCVTATELAATLQAWFTDQLTITQLMDTLRVWLGNPAC